MLGVVNNAGVSVKADVEVLSLSNIERVFDVNFLGTVRVTKALLPMLRKHRGLTVLNFLYVQCMYVSLKLKYILGRVVNTSSVLALMPTPMSAAYTSSKFAGVL